jgi:hypothetical protein
MQRINNLLLVVTMGLLVASCGAGTGGQTAGIDRGGITSGPVTGYGSVWVNGSEYFTDDAEIEANGQTATEADLAIGQVVVLTSLASGNRLSAQRIIYESNLKGPVEAGSVDALNGSFVALGQQVIVDSGTSFAAGIIPADITGLLPGDIIEVIVEVSGLVDTAGRIRATRIEKEDAPYQVQLSGTVVLGSGMQFTIGTQLVDYSTAMVTGFPGGLITAGDRVRVSGSDFGGSGEIVATEVAYRGSSVLIEDGEDGDIEGLITDFVSPQSFSLAGFSVVTNAQTEYSGGTAGDLANNIRIEAEGLFDVNGTLIADEIEFREEGEARIEATVDSVNVAQNTVTVFGVDVEVTPLTRIEDKRDELRPFGVGNLSSGDFLKIEGSWDGDSKVIATRLERLEGEDKFKIRGPITDAASPAFTLLGKIVQTSATFTNYSVGDAGDQTITLFFIAIEDCLLTPPPEGCLAEAGWAADGPLSFADEVELED